MNLILNVNQNFANFLDESRRDIWRYAKILSDSKIVNFVDPLQKDFTKIERIGDFWVKREDESAVGSHKFRALAFQISQLLEAKIDRAVLSSSGNAAIAASQILPENTNLKLFVFLSKKTPPAKLAGLKFSKNLVPILSERPLRMAKYAAKHFDLRDLRPSVDPNAAVGFCSLGFEIFEQKPAIENIFSFATSFASVRGIAEAFKFLVKIGARQKMPKIFAVTSSGRLAGELSRQRVDTSRQAKVVQWTEVDTSGQRVAKSAEASAKAEQLVNISDAEILATRQKLPELKTSNEGLASLAAATKIKPQGETLVILTGRAWPDKNVDLDKFEEADNFAEADKMVARHG
ncbi:MAG: PLP-dependent lyase/thiolase [Patescibacteria group bacterium]